MSAPATEGEAPRPKAPAWQKALPWIITDGWLAELGDALAALEH